MTRTSYNTEKSRLEKEMAKLQKKIQTLQAKERKPKVAEIVRAMREYDISPEEIAAAFNRKTAGRAPSAPRKAAATTKRVIAPKYRHPETQATWTGRGKAPRWITDAEAAGTSRDAFLIAAESA
ncbi:H-NS histone family protein [Castellaniella daejeonensis]|mgnify:CR=1 FL=1|jgi:DNA-binding protein H-NS|uniref:H-NS histone family protein n=1 Tax=Castellaniella daejeonensis TaxID=659013 RepID=A0ABN0TI89_9BURK|nr:H-NS histone family protein [Castellaniella sp.]HET8702237.1 H-NS histone family protein [Castellaniella sp.]